MAGTVDLKAIVKHMQTELGMTEKGGNGRAVLKGNTILFQNPYFYRSNVGSAESIKKDWSRGGDYGKYFEEDMGIVPIVKNVEFIEDDKKFQGQHGYVQVTLTFEQADTKSLVGLGDQEYKKLIITDPNNNRKTVG